MKAETRTANDLPLATRLFAEFIGTLLLSFVAGLAKATEQQGGNLVSHSIADGLIVLAMIFSLGDISGAHINPAVSLAFALRRAFPWTLVLPYWLVQFAGGILAACAVQFVLPDFSGVLQAEIAHVGAFSLEAALSLILVFVILATSSRHQVLGADAALPVAGVVILCGLSAGPYGGAAMNPARSLGPLIANKDWDAFLSGSWIFVAAPFVGAGLAVVLARLLRGKPKLPDCEASQGEA